MAKFLIAILIIGGILTGAYFLLKNNNSFKISFLGTWTDIQKSTPLTTHTGDPVVSTSATIKDTARAIGTNVWQTVQNAGAWIKTQGSDLVTSMVSSATSTLTDTAKSVTQKTISSIQNKLGLSTNDATTNSLVISYVIRRGDVASFAVHNTFASSTQSQLSYSVDWGDGIIESETNSIMKDIFIFTHAWQKQGQYTITFTMTNGNKKSTYTTHITVE